MKGLIKKYIVALVIFLLVDSLWLGIIAQSMYQELLGPVINLRFNLYAAAIFYALYATGIVYFAIVPGVNERSWKKGLVNGGVLGGLCYATYDMTNLATIEGWPIMVVVIDIIWGIFITGATAGLTTYIVNMK